MGNEINRASSFALSSIYEISCPKYHTFPNVHSCFCCCTCAIYTWNFECSTLHITKSYYGMPQAAPATAGRCSDSAFSSPWSRGEVEGAKSGSADARRGDGTITRSCCWSISSSCDGWARDTVARSCLLRCSCCCSCSRRRRAAAAITASTRESSRPSTSSSPSSHPCASRCRRAPPSVLSHKRI